MSNRETTLIGLIIIALSFVAGIYAYPHLPAIVAAHWDAAGNVNGYMSKFWGVFLLPIITLGIFLLFKAIPHLDPHHENIERFKGHFNGFVIVMLGLMFYLELLILAYNIGYHIDIVRFLLPAFAVLFFDIGILLSHARRNWFVGIRTPWTLSSEKVWNETHALGSGLFKLAALIALAGIVFRPYAFWFAVVPVIVFAIVCVVYSYVAFQREKGGR